MAEGGISAGLADAIVAGLRKRRDGRESAPTFIDTPWPLESLQGRINALPSDKVIERGSVADRFPNEWRALNEAWEADLQRACAAEMGAYEELEHELGVLRPGRDGLLVFTGPDAAWARVQSMLQSPVSMEPKHRIVRLYAGEKLECLSAERLREIGLRRV